MILREPEEIQNTASAGGGWAPAARAQHRALSGQVDTHGWTWAQPGTTLGHRHPALKSWSEAYVCSSNNRKQLCIGVSQENLLSPNWVY